MARAPKPNTGTTGTYVREPTTNKLSRNHLPDDGEPRRRPYLLVIDGPSLGRVYPVNPAGAVIGRSRECDVPIEDDRISRRHAMVLARGDKLTVADLESTNGVYVNGKKVQRAQIADGDRLRIGGTTLKLAMQDELEERFQAQLYDSATRDPLTGAYNKRFFNETLKSDFAWAARHGHPLTLMMFDIDHFKKINDEHGHPAGDTVLKQLTALAQGVLRQEDVLCRFGGEEFAVLLRDTAPDKAAIVAERLRGAVEKQGFEHESQAISATVSVGFATLRGPSMKTRAELLKAADAALYKAKQDGRNRVVAHAEPRKRVTTKR